jgi:hypothetical protein
MAMSELEAARKAKQTIDQAISKLNQVKYYMQSIDADWWTIEDEKVIDEFTQDLDAVFVRLDKEF